jgi:antibiotic biosynthesis monooxygenase (ABM) superfamily enzyme
MGKVILQITYEVKPELRDQYLALAKEMKTHFAGERKKNYAIFEQKGRKDAFVEQFVCATKEEFEALEDDMTEISERLVDRLEGLLKDGSARYFTLTEIE